MHADAAQGFGQRGIIGEDRAAVAVAAERLGREEAGRGGKAEGAEAAALVGARRSPAPRRRARTAPRPRRPPRWRRWSAALPEQVDRHHRLRLAGRACARSRCRASANSRSMLKVASSTSTKTGVAPVSATASPVAQNVNDGQNTASPRPMPFAISTISSASVPLAQVTTCLAPQNAASVGLQRGHLRTVDELAMRRARAPPPRRSLCRAGGAARRCR